MHYGPGQWRASAFARGGCGTYDWRCRNGTIPSAKIAKAKTSTKERAMLANVGQTAADSGREAGWFPMCDWSLARHAANCSPLARTAPDLTHSFAPPPWPLWLRPPQLLPSCSSFLAPPTFGRATTTAVLLTMVRYLVILRQVKRSKVVQL